MELHINDLSLTGQFQHVAEFRAVFDPLLQFRLTHRHLAGKIYCSQALSSCFVTQTESLQHAVLNTKNKGYIALVLRWLSSGPFWDDDRFSNVNDYFHFEGTDVTDQGLGEAARRILAGVNAGSFSFVDKVGRFMQSPLRVGHGLEEEPLGSVEIPNFWSVEDIDLVLEAPPSGWEEMLALATQKFPGLVFASPIGEVLKKTPFHIGISDRVFDILHVLQMLVAETNENGSLTATGMELWQKHSVGDKAWITDESDPNKRAFKQELTFADPTNITRNIFCSWHGKVKIGQFRIHFEWPRPRNQRIIKVVYIGPKITKQ